MTTRLVQMTVYAIEADQVEVTQLGQPRGTQFVNGRITVSAHGEGHLHRFVVTDDRRWWPGDTLTIQLKEKPE